MKWFDSNFDYVQELIDRWNSRRKKIRAIYFIIAAILIIAGILTAIFPVRIFIVIQCLAAAAIIIVGIYHFIAFSSMTYYFRDYTLLLSGILNVLMGVLIMIMPLTLTVQVITFMFAFVLLFSGFQKLSLSSRLKYFGIPHTGSLTFSGILNIILAVIFILLPFISALALNYILAAYLILTGIVLLIEAISMQEIKYPGTGGI